MDRPEYKIPLEYQGMINFSHVTWTPNLYNNPIYLNSFDSSIPSQPNSLCQMVGAGTQPNTAIPNFDYYRYRVMSNPALDTQSNNFLIDQTKSLYSQNRVAPDENFMNPHINNNLQQRSGPMRAWLNTHLHDPYPSSQEKQKLADECNKTYIQVCTWFANARRSLRRQGIIGPRLRRTKTGSSKEFTDPGNANQRSKNGSNIQLNMNSFQIETEIAKSCQSVMPQVSSPSPIQLQAKKIHDL